MSTSVTVTDLNSITSAADNLWNQVTVTAANTDTSLAATGLSEGSYKLYAVNSSGGLSSASTSTITIDNTAPAAASLAFASDTGISTNDRITSAGTVNVSGLEGGAVWEYSVNAGQNWTGGTGSSFTLTEGSYANGNVLVRQTDVAGNTSTAVLTGSTFVSLSSQRSAGISGNLDDTSPVLAPLAGGGYALGWTGSTTDRGTDAFWRRFAADGSLIAGSPTRVSFDTSTNSDSLISIIQLTDGKFVIAWQNFSSGGVVRLQRYNSDGTPLGSVISSANLITNPNAIQGTVIEPLSDGGFVLAYSGQSNGPSDSDIHVRKYDASGNPTTANIIRIGTALSPDQAPDIVVGPSGTFTISWRGRTGGVDDVWVQSFLADGQLSGSSIKLLSTSSYFGVPIGILPNGDFVSVIGRSNDIFVVRSSSTGALVVSTQLTGSSSGQSNDTQPVVAVTTDGGYAVAWLGDTPSVSAYVYEVWVQRFAPDNSLVGGKTMLSGLAGNFADSSLVISALSDNKFVVAWAGKTGSNTNEEDIFFQVFDELGSPFGAKQQLGTPLISRDYNPKITALANGNFAIAWEGQTADSQGVDVFSQVFSQSNLIVDSTPPLSGTLVSATLTTAGNATVSSSELGTIYLVNSDLTVSNLASIIGASDDRWNRVSITSINTDTNLSLEGLAAGSYKAYVVDEAGNVSGGSSGTVTIQGAVSLSDITLDLIAASDSGSLNSDNLTNVQSPTITVSSLDGKAFTTGDLIEIIDTSNSSTVVGSYSVQSGDLNLGTWNAGAKNITLTVALSDGAHALRVRAKDSNGSPGLTNSAALTVTIDATRPTLTWNTVTETGFTFTASDAGSTTLTARLGSTALPVTVTSGALTTYNVSEMPTALVDLLNVMDAAGNVSSMPFNSTTLYVVLGAANTQSYTFGGGTTFAAYGFGGADTLSTSSSNDYIFGGDGNDFLQGWGGNDIIYGGNGNDTFYPGQGNDTSFGGADDDTIYDEAGTDVIDGGSGNDTIRGGDGADQITLGGGVDIVIFNSQTGADTITDFVAGDDLISLAKSALAALGATGALTADEYVSGPELTAGQDATDRIVYNSSNGALYYDADGSGAGAAVLLATFTGAPVLTVAHFTVI